MSYFNWRPYVSVAERRAKALRKMKKLKKKGLDIQPIQIEKLKIAKTFWGKAWCEHIESFSDYANRLPRGRTYVRNGSVCHLVIEPGKISAIVSGSSLYNVEITIKPLPPKRWKTIKTKCSGQIGSLLELLGGKLSDSVMNVVCHRQEGLFPTPKEINLSCNCPDWATMCKHVAAVLYGVGARLDHMPHQLFLLRAVNHEELIDVSAAITDAAQKGKTKRRHIDDSALADIFGIEIEDKNKSTAVNEKKSISSRKQRSAPRKTKISAKPANKTKTKKPQLKQKKTAKKSKNQKRPKQPINLTFPVYLTGAGIRKKRKSLGLTQAAFAKAIGVSSVITSQWERQGRKRLNLKKITEKMLRKIW